MPTVIQSSDKVYQIISKFILQLEARGGQKLARFFETPCIASSKLKRERKINRSTVSRLLRKSVCNTGQAKTQPSQPLNCTTRRVQALSMVLDGETKIPGRAMR